MQFRNWLCLVAVLAACAVAGTGCGDRGDPWSGTWTQGDGVQDTTFRIERTEGAWLVSFMMWGEVQDTNTGVEVDGTLRIGQSVFERSGNRLKFTSTPGAPPIYLTEETSATSASPPPEAPGWLLKKIDPLTAKLGDANAEVWWAEAKAEQLSELFGTDDEPKGKSVYLLAMRGDFDNVSALAVGLQDSTPSYTWVWVAYSADFKEVTYTAGWEPYRPKGVRLYRMER